MANAAKVTYTLSLHVALPIWTIGYSSYWGGPSNVTVVNQGTVGPTQAGTIYVTGASATNQGTFQATGTGSLSIQPTSWTNAAAAQITVSGNSTLSLSGTYSNAGTITSTNSTVNLGGAFTLA